MRPGLAHLKKQQKNHFLIWAITSSFSLFLPISTVNSQYVPKFFLPMTWFEPQTYGIVNNCSAITTTVHENFTIINGWVSQWKNIGHTGHLKQTVFTFSLTPCTYVLIILLREGRNWGIWCGHYLTWLNPIDLNNDEWMKKWCEKWNYESTKMCLIANQFKIVLFWFRSMLLFAQVNPPGALE